MIAQELEVSLHMAFVEARQKRHEFITVEHLLLALLDNPTAAEVLRACGANMDELRKNLAQHIAEQTPRIAADREVDTQPTLGFQRVIQRAILHVQSSGKKEGYRRERPGRHLRREGLARGVFPPAAGHRAARRRQLHFARHHQDAAGPPGQGRAGGRQEGQAETSNARSTNYTQNLNALALAGKIEPADRPRQRARARGADAVPPAQEQPLLVGEAGVGKTAIAEGLARAHRRGQRAGPAHQNARCMRLDMARCWPARNTAATSSRRLKAVLKQLVDNPNAILFHRRDPHGDRRRSGLGRHAGCVQSAQAGAFPTAS